METEEVEVVYSINSVWQTMLLILLGGYVGLSVGVGMSWSDLHELASRKPVINGDVTIRANGHGATLSNMHINANGAEYAVKYVEKDCE